MITLSRLFIWMQLTFMCHRELRKKEKLLKTRKLQSRRYRPFHSKALVLFIMIDIIMSKKKKDKIEEKNILFKEVKL